MAHGSPMKQRTQNFILGLTTIGFFALFMMTITFLYPMMRLPGQSYTVYFPHDAGLAPLKKGSPVMLGSAIEKGRVTDLRVTKLPDPNNPGGTRELVFLVEFELDSDVTLWGDCYITTDQPALGGNGFLSIVSVGTDGVPHPPEISIDVGTLFQRKIRPFHGKPPQSFQSVVALLSRRLLGDGGFIDMLMSAVDPGVEGSPIRKLGQILDDLRVATIELRNQMSPTEQTALLAKIAAIIDDVGAMTRSLRSEAETGDRTALLGKAHQLLDQLTASLNEVNAMIVAERPVIHETLGEVSEIARTVNRDMLTSIRGELDRGNDGALISKTHKALDQVNTALAQVITLTETGERLINSNAPAVEDAIDSLKSAATNIEQLTLKILLNPNALIWPTVVPGEQQAVFLAAQSFASAASELNASAQRLDAMLSALPRSGPVPDDIATELERIRTGVRMSFDRFQQAEESLFKALR